MGTRKKLLRYDVKLPNYSNFRQLEHISRVLSEKKGRYRKLHLPLTERERVIFNTLFGKEDGSTR